MFTIDRKRMMVFADGQEVRMTRKQFDLLMFMRSHRLVTLADMSQQVWGCDHYVPSNTYRSHIGHLRKMGFLIRSRHGFGYELQGTENIQEV